MRFRILGSSSAGNSALICTEKCKVLLDAGFTGKRMEALLEQAGVDLLEIDAIFITHEHSDHITGLRGLTRRHPDLRVFANETTARIVQERVPRRLNWQIFENGRPFIFADLTVSPFSIPHDAYDPVGYHFCQRIEAGGNAAGSGEGAAGKSEEVAADSGSATTDGGANTAGGLTRNCHVGNGTAAGNRADTAASGGEILTGRSICWLTDLGYVTEAARRHANACDLLVIEANHDPDMLERCETRSWSTKQRIRGRHGHLSNQAAYDLLAAVDNPRWRHVCLAHISAECNSLEIVEKQFTALRNGTHKLDIHIFDPASPCPSAEFDLRTAADACDSSQARESISTAETENTAAADISAAVQAATVDAQKAVLTANTQKTAPTPETPEAAQAAADTSATAADISATASAPLVAVSITATQVTRTTRESSASAQAGTTGSHTQKTHRTSVTQIEIALNF